MHASLPLKRSATTTLTQRIEKLETEVKGIEQTLENLEKILSSQREMITQIKQYIGIENE